MRGRGAGLEARARSVRSKTSILVASENTNSVPIKACETGKGATHQVECRSCQPQTLNTHTHTRVDRRT